MRAVLLVAITIAAACGSHGSNTGGDGGNSGSGDGGMPPVADAPMATDMTCATLPPVSSGTCAVTAGSATSLLLEGEVLTPGTVYHGGQVAINSSTGAITCVGCNCAAGGETVVSCPGASISPGLIDVHDHITYAQNLPTPATTERYDDRQQWRRGYEGHTENNPPGGATNAQIQWAEIRHLMSGTTSLSASGGVAGMVRNLDKSTMLGAGITEKALYFDTFPLDDSNGPQTTANCNYGSDTPETAADIAQDSAYEPHTAEGVDNYAHNEFLCESSTTYDTMTPGVSNDIMIAKTSMIHAAAMTAADYAAMANAGTGMVWSPRSNISLYGDTARVSVASRLGVNIALGTDWMPSGSMNILRELACASDFNTTYLASYFTPQALWEMVTQNAAKVAKMDSQLGVIATGHLADISVFAAQSGKSPFEAVIDAQPQDVALVMRGGTVLYGDDALVTALNTTSCDAVSVCSTNKRVCVMSEFNTTYTSLASTNSALYPTFECGAPMNEPTCLPTRPNSVSGSTVFTGTVTSTDSDGDGIPDAMDNCPTVWNPIRPMDNGAQPDADGDGMGDVCDPCPLDKTNSCH